MRLKVSCRVTNTGNWNLDLNIKGAGTIEDPCLVTGGSYDDRDWFSITIADSDAFIEFRKQNLRGIFLTNCNNIMISQSAFRKIVLIKCSNIILKEVEITKKLIIKSSATIDLYDSGIKILDVIESEDILASNCEFVRVKKRSYLSSLLMEHSIIKGYKYYFKKLINPM
ncbi:MAG: hypothetical protein ACFE9T_11660 [Promethearchaeota archaeon]